MTNLVEEHYSILSDAVQHDLAWDPEQSDVRFNAILDLEDAGLLDAPRLHRAGSLTWRASRGGMAVAMMQQVVASARLAGQVRP